MNNLQIAALAINHSYIDIVLIPIVIVPILWLYGYMAVCTIVVIICVYTTSKIIYLPNSKHNLIDILC